MSTVLWDFAEPSGNEGDMETVFKELSQSMESGHEQLMRGAQVLWGSEEDTQPSLKAPREVS